MQHFKDDPKWQKRNIFVSELMTKNKSVIDYGCGDKSFLKYYTPSEYLGIDLNPKADIIADLETYTPKSKVYDYALILGVLEYLDSPFEFVQKVSSTAETIIILHLFKVNRKKEWTNNFNKEQVIEEYSKVFKQVLHIKHNQYDIFVCQKS